MPSPSLATIARMHLTYRTLHPSAPPAACWSLATAYSEWCRGAVDSTGFLASVEAFRATHPYARVVRRQARRLVTSL